MGIKKDFESALILPFINKNLPLLKIKTIMIEKIHIENFKSIQNLDLELGRVNVFIGENGSGKTNILEAIGMVAAAGSKNLNDDYLSLKGIRVNKPGLMKSGFDNDYLEKPVLITISVKDQAITFELEEDKETQSWKNDKVHFDPYVGIDESINTASFIELINNPNFQKILNQFKHVKYENDLAIDEKITLDLSSTQMAKESIKSLKISLGSDNWNSFINDAQGKMLETIRKTSINDFLIYCPENTLLRRTDTEGHTKPLGIRGEGLLEHLSILMDVKSESFDEIKEKLKVISWFEDFNIKTNFLTGGKSMELEDRFLAEGVKTIGLRNANEGFLYVLFYLTLFSSKATPKFFAIDNFDNALNPKLCKELLSILTKIAKDKNKQVILTTHNPAVLDGLNLNDDEQKLFTVFRSKKTGETKVDVFKRRPTPEGVSSARLSEMFMNGSLGGLPDNF
jgi:predicted ATPase